MVQVGGGAERDRGRKVMTWLVVIAGLLILIVMREEK